MGATSQATSAPSYDGLWSVVIVTETGTCDRAYRYPIRISKGTLINAGDEAFVVTGKVSVNGSVSVTVSHGEKHATGSGRYPGMAEPVHGQAATVLARGKPSAATDSPS